MLGWLVKKQIAKFEKQFNYDFSYGRELYDVSPRAFFRFARISGMAEHREGIPRDAWFAAKIAAAMAEDCGPCTQLSIDMAERQGVDPAILRAIVARDYVAMPEDVALAARFTEASLHHAPEADDLREEILLRWGKRGLISLAFAMLSARTYPTLKYALGHGRACTRVVIGGETRPVLRDLTGANTIRTKTAAA